MNSFNYDIEYFKSKGIETIILSDETGEAKILLIPAYQGRVMTSTASGCDGNSYGWINYKLIDSQTVSPQFNPVGGEERLWIGPEGGPFSYYFRPGVEQVYGNWKVPAIIDTEPYSITELTDTKVCFEAEANLQNASGHSFQMGISRSVNILSREQISQTLGVEIHSNIKTVGYKSINTITNLGDKAWDKHSGMPSVWMLCTFNPTTSTIVIIPYKEDAQGTIVNDEYFGKVPTDRLKVDNGLIYFKIDGLLRSKIGLPDGRAKDICGSYDSENKILTLIKYTLPTEKKAYLNSQWGHQDEPFCGDVVNSYNDGPTETGFVQGPFYEIETSSPAADLKPGESLTHEEYVFHLEGDDAELIAKSVLGVEL